MEEEIKKLNEKIEDAKKNFGDVETRDAILEKAKYYHHNKNYEMAQKTYMEAYEIAGGASKKMDILFEILLIALDLKHLELIRTNIEKCKKLLDEGGDWEHKNKLQVFDGIYNIMIRNFKTSATLLIDSVPTFTATEIFTFKDLVFYSVITSLVSLDRATLRQKVIHSPEVLAEIREIPYLKQFADSLFYCDYLKFFQAFPEIIEQVKNDKYLGKHSKYFTKEMRIVAYNQFLESYKSVDFNTMSKSFGVSKEFLDKELSYFIASGRINCKIDKVAGIIESNRPDERIALYMKIVKQGDFLLDRIQKLSRAMDL